MVKKIDDGRIVIKIEDGQLYVDFGGYSTGDILEILDAVKKRIIERDFKEGKFDFHKEL